MCVGILIVDFFRDNSFDEEGNTWLKGFVTNVERIEKLKVEELVKQGISYANLASGKRLAYLVTNGSSVQSAKRN